MKRKAILLSVMTINMIPLIDEKLDENGKNSIHQAHDRNCNYSGSCVRKSNGIGIVARLYSIKKYLRSKGSDRGEQRERDKGGQCNNWAIQALTRTGMLNKWSAGARGSGVERDEAGWHGATAAFPASLACNIATIKSSPPTQHLNFPTSSHEHTFKVIKN